MESLDYDSQFERMKKDVTSAFAKVLDVRAARSGLHMKASKVWVEDNLSPDDWKSQRDAVVGDKTWGVPVYASVDLIDTKNGGKVLSTAKKVKIAELPKNTVFGSFIVNGKHYQVSNQLRRKPGAYITTRENGEKRAEFHIAGRPFKLMIDQKTSAFTIDVGATPVPLYPILSRLGMSDSVLAKAWGQDVLDANKAVTEKAASSAVMKVGKYFSLTSKDATFTNPEEAAKSIATFLQDNTKMNPWITKTTLGKEFSEVTPEAIMLGARELSLAAANKRKTDDSEALEFKKILAVSDVLRERIMGEDGELSPYMNEFRRKISRKLESPKGLTRSVSSLIGSQQLTPAIESFFMQSSLSNTTDQTNPINMMNGTIKVTTLGEGGITKLDAIPEKEKSLHPSTLGFIDPIHTPDSSSIGVTLNLPVGVTKKGDTLYASVVDAKTGKESRVSPQDIRGMIVSFQDQYENGKPISAKVKAIVNGEHTLIDAKKVDAIYKSPKLAFSVSSNSVPFLASTGGVRAQMATKMIEQAIPLAAPEAPLVQIKAAGGTVEQAIGEGFSGKAPVSGVIKSVSKDKIVIDSKGKETVVDLYSNMPLNNKAYVDSRSLVKPGDTIKEGEPIFDSNFTDKGVLALGTNLRAAYIPWKGYNFEDGIVITESARAKLTSQHLHQMEFAKSNSVELNKTKYFAKAPSGVTNQQLGTLDDDGVVKKGTILNPGDPLWVGVKNARAESFYAAMSKLGKTVSPIRGMKEEWGSDYQGEVVNVVKTGGGVKVFVKTLEPAQIGDKLTNRLGAKGIITKIIPDAESPHTADGRPIDILLNPHGIVTRINPSQILETAAAKVAEKNGTPYVVDNFGEPDHAAAVQSSLDKAKLSDTETLYDPETKKPLGEVLVGPQYILKLGKQATSQFSARSDGRYDINMSPSKGGEDGAKALDQLAFYSLLSHGARANIKEMATFKATNSDQFWNWFVAGPKLGLIKPKQEPTFAYKKFESYLKGAGVNVERNGSKFSLGPMTDAQTDKLSSGEILEPLFIRGKDLREEEKGLLDPSITGGTTGTRWGHYALAEPMPNPVFEDPIKKLTGLKPSQFEGLVSGELFVDPATGEFADAGITGGAAIKAKLDRIDIGAEIKDLTDKAKKSTTPKALDDINKKLKYLHALKKSGLSASEAYIQTKIPIIPPQYRRIVAKDDGTLTVPGVNNLYRDLGLVNNELKWQNESEFINDEMKQGLRKSLYGGMKAVAGLGTPVAYYAKKREPQGFIDAISGGKKAIKTGFFQHEILRRRQDVVARGTIIPEPKLGIDEVGLPEDISWEIFSKFVEKDLIGRVGINPMQASEYVKSRNAMATASLGRVMKEHPVMLNRAPSLHKFSMMAFMPQITDGKAIKIPPLVVKGFNADFDGDQQINQVVAFIPLSLYNADQEKWSLRRVAMSARFKELVGYIGESGEFVVCHLEDFPRLEKVGTKDHIDFWSVPAGIRVVAMDEKSNRPVLAEVSNWSFHRQRDVEIVSLGSGRQIITDDDERAVYGLDAGSLKWCRRSPKDAANQFVPVLDQVSPEIETVHEIQLNLTDSRIRQQATLSASFGYLLGATVGDGWASHTGDTPKALNLAATSSTVVSAWKGALLSVFSEMPTITRSETTENKYPNSSGCSRYTVSSSALSGFLADMVGRGAQHKHLPPFFLSAPRDFILGMLGGLWDTDGSMSWSEGKSKPQFMCSYTSSSIRLVQEIQHALRSVEVSSSITATKTPAGKPFWALTVSTVDLYRVGGIPVHHEGKKLAQDRFVQAAPPNPDMAYSRYRLMPTPAELALELRSIIGSSHRSEYVTLSKAIDRKYVSKSMALRLIEMVGESCKHPLFAEWKALASMPGIHFEKVVGYEVTNIAEDGYDLTVPGYETFMAIDGVVLSNTMNVHVPVLPDAVREAYKLMPSANLFNPGTGSVMIAPQNESTLGLFMMSKDPALRKLIVEKLPLDLQSKYSKKVLEKDSMGELMNDIAKSAPADHGKIVASLKELGDDHAYRIGFTVSMKDLTPHIEGKAKIMFDLDRKIRRLDLGTAKGRADGADAISKAGEFLTKAVKASVSNGSNNLGTMVNSGARGNFNQLKQIVSTPLMVDDHRGSVIPIPVKNSFSEGLDFSDYWTTLYGARSAAVDKQEQTKNPGAFGKDIMATSIVNVISSADCGATKGLRLPLRSSDGKVRNADLEDRFLAKDVSVGGTVIARAGEQVTSSIINKMMEKKVGSLEVRSPITCRLPRGICAKCYGVGGDGNTPAIGDNVGADAGMSMSEPLTQMTMRTFHTGGISGSRAIIEGYPKIDALFKMQNLKSGAATLSQRDGKVERIAQSAGGLGKNVLIGGVEHFVGENEWDDSLRVGKSFNKGDSISKGVVQPKDMLPLKGMIETQSYMSGQVQEAFEDQGVPLKRRTVETVVRALGNTTKIIDPGNSAFLPGDIAPFTVVEHFNSAKLGKSSVYDSIGHISAEDNSIVRKGEQITDRLAALLDKAGIKDIEIGNQPIRHAEFISGVARQPEFRGDWMAQLGYQQARKAIVRGAGVGAESDLHGLSPVPAYAYGAEFGDDFFGKIKGGY